jgi:hypothetical protein
MKMYATVEITKGWETWNKMAVEMNPEMESEGMKFIFKGCDMDEKKLHLIIEVESMEKAKEFSTRPNIVSRRVEAGAVVESTVMIPLKD